MALLRIILFIAAASTVESVQSARPSGSKNSRWESYQIVSSAAPANAAGLSRVLQLKLASEQLQQYGPSFEDLSAEIIPETASRLHVKIKPTGQRRWEVPESIVPRPAAQPDLKQDALLYSVQQPTAAPGQPFALSVTRTANKQPAFDTTGHRFMFKDQFIEVTTNVPADADLYGLGETVLPTGLLLPRDGTIITLWNRDLPAAVATANVYGSHPFLLQVNADGSSHGLFFLNSNGADFILNATSVTYRAIGGLLDLYVFMGPSPEAVIQQYHQVIGTSVMPPFWALGLHQGKWGYANVSVLEAVVANYSASGVPLECLWLDIEHQSSRFRTMTFDPVRFPVTKMRGFVDRLHAAGQRWVPIQDAAIAVGKGYRAYEEGSRDDVWIKDHRGRPYVGQVWPGPAVYPDYLSAPKVSSWLKAQLAQWYKQAPFDGIWLDMNEASNFCTGLNCYEDASNKTAMHWLTVETPLDYNLTDLIPRRTKCQMRCDKAPPSNSLEFPPYAIHNFPTDAQGQSTPINHGVISPSAVHADGSKEYDAHNLFGTAMAMRHYEAFTAVTGKRPFMILRSTFPGAGRFTGHWTGDNAANWDGFYQSIASVINPSFWGINMVGPDICGFIDMAEDGAGDPPTRVLPDPEFEELCNRWASAGAFYPFSRNHNTYFTRPHEFYRWPAVAASAKRAYGLRYQLLTYFYSSLFVAHSRGGTLARPLLFTDPSDTKARNATKQWMMGEALLVSPVLKYQTTTVKPYFTAGTWYSAWDYSRLSVPAGQAMQLQVPLGDIAVHYRGGAIIPVQPAGRDAAVTRDVRFSPVTLVVALPGSPSTGNAQPAAGPLPAYGFEESCAAAHKRAAGQLVSCGLLYADNDTVEVSSSNTVQVWFTATTAPGARSGMVDSVIKANAGQARDRLRIAAVHIVGVAAAAPAAASQRTAAPAGGASRQQLAPAATIAGGSLPAGASLSLDEAAGVLRIVGLDLDVGEELALNWSL